MRFDKGRKSPFKKAVTVLLLIVLVMAAMPSMSRGIVIPVFDYLKSIWDEASHKARMHKLMQILRFIMQIRRVQQETREFFAAIYRAMSGGSLINPEDLMWQILYSTFLKDRLKLDPWWLVWNSEQKLSEIFPELRDYSYLTGTGLYKTDPFHRAYVDRLILQLEERVTDLENLREHMQLMRKVYEKNVNQINLFHNRLNEYVQANQVGRLIGLIANLELMNARLNLQLNFNRRVQNTFLLKDQVRGIVDFKREVNRYGGL